MPSLLDRMTSALNHRGPDEHGYFSDKGVHLGHRRLSIVDLATGQQPMSNEDGTMWLVYNGEIFNHAGLRPELEQAGHRYKTRCDTETILHAYEQYGAGVPVAFPRHVRVRHLGPQQTRTLFCARDRLGIKPFYYFWDGRVIRHSPPRSRPCSNIPRSPAAFEEDAAPRIPGLRLHQRASGRCSAASAS